MSSGVRSTAIYLETMIPSAHVMRLPRLDEKAVKLGNRADDRVTAYENTKDLD
jgi:hypothetical protein